MKRTMLNGIRGCAWVTRQKRAWKNPAVFVMYLDKCGVHGKECDRKEVWKMKNIIDEIIDAVTDSYNEKQKDSSRDTVIDVEEKGVF